ncbi:MAG: glutamate 5-kinase [Actinomycetota bacterium]|nr:glutamate 5-kinase [Actinomycetota bacterium]
MRRKAQSGRPVVVKVGSSSLAIPQGGGINQDGLIRVVDQVDALWAAGYPTVLVSSGAVAAGLSTMGMTERPKDLPGLQVAAAVGQSKLVERYAREFAKRERIVGQVLITRDVVAGREQYLHARAALDHMLALGVVPIVNENDTVVVDELKFGDNDRLAAIVSHLVEADLLVILTDTPGLYDNDPRLDGDAQLIKAVRDTDSVLDDLHLSRSVGAVGSGGVATKIAAARMAAWSGIPTVIADAADGDAAVKAVAGVEIGTWIAPRESRLAARKLWIAFGLPSWGRITVDDGAISALRDRGGSLLAVGVTAVTGDFSVGDAVEVVDRDGNLVGKGLAGVGSSVLQQAAGRHTSEVGGEVIHRDHLVVLV